MSLKLNPGKLERWEREERLSGSLGQPAENGKAVPLSISNVDRRPPERALSPLREVLGISVASPKASEHPQTIWTIANIPGSPNLTRFFTALKVDDEFPIPPPLRLPSPNRQFITQDQWSDLVKKPIDETAEVEADNLNAVAPLSERHRRLSNSPELLICKWLLLQIERPWTPLNEVYPFPTTIQSRTARNGTYIIKASPGKARRLQIMESEARLQKLQKVFSPDNPGLIDEMDHLAGLYRKEGKYWHAESLYHRVALVRKDTRGPCHVETLESYLKVIAMKAMQKIDSETLTLHQDLDRKIQKLLGPYHHLALDSRDLLAEILSHIGKNKEAEILKRELLQIMLNEFGQRHKKTVRAMAELGHTMTFLKQYTLSEELLWTGFQIVSQDVVYPEEYLYNTQLYLGDALKLQGRYVEGCSLLKDALRRSMSSHGMEHPTTLLGIYCLADLLRLNGELGESELLMRPNLLRLGKALGPKPRIILLSVHEFADTMAGLEMWTEGASLYEYVFRGYSECYGPDHYITCSVRHQLEESYAMQGLYEDQSACADRLEIVLDKEEDTLAYILNSRRKYRQPRAGGIDDDSDEVEEVRPYKRRRVMTCTYNLKTVQG